jgi:hypothetical protein
MIENEKKCNRDMRYGYGVLLVQFACGWFAGFNILQESEKVEYVLENVQRIFQNHPYKMKTKGP